MLYVITIVPSWWTLFKFFSSIRKKELKKGIIWGGFLFFLLVLPYAYLAIGLSNLPWQLTAVILIIPIYGFYRILIHHHHFSLFWNAYAKVYDGLNHFRPYKLLIQKLTAEACQLVKSGAVLDYGCGTGNLSVNIARKCDVDVFGLDTSESMIKRAIAKTLRDSRVHFNTISSSPSGPIPVPKNLDLIVINNVLYTIENEGDFLKKLLSYLRPGGMMLISEPKERSNLFHLFYSHFKIKGDTLRAMLDNILLLVYLPALLFFNLAISIKTRTAYHFYSRETLIKLVEDLGLKVVKVEEVYSNQNILIAAKY